MQKTNINPACLQQMLESAANAADKGQSQFFTPPEFARKLTAALPRVRPALVDLNCGNGQLLQASVDPKSTTKLLGADIDPCKCLTELPTPNSQLRHSVQKINRDLTLLYPLLKEVGFTADCFVLNPPWRLFWYRDRLADLANSDLPAVRQAFQATEPGAPKGTIDSTIATLLMALDLTTNYGEGFLIANNNTLERLLFGDKAPHAAIGRHVWLHLVVPGNPMTGLDHCHEVGTPNSELRAFETGIIYFARSHLNGPNRFKVGEDIGWEGLRNTRLRRQGVDLSDSYYANKESEDRWQAAKDRVAELESGKPRVPWNLWLTVNGRINTALSSFQVHSVKVNKQEAARLHALRGKAPMELVIQRNQRDELLHVLGLDPDTLEPLPDRDTQWRIQPELTLAVQAAIQEYHGARAPLYPLSDIQRLGYLDEQNKIECRKDLLHTDGRLAFKAGGCYPIRTQTVNVVRTKWKPNSYTGEQEKYELSGQELAIYLLSTEVMPAKIPKDGPAGTEFSFMEESIKNSKHTKVETAKKVKGAEDDSTLNPQTSALNSAVDFTLQELCEHFIIPDVPDVATVNPLGYEANLKLLEELEALCP